MKKIEKIKNVLNSKVVKVFVSFILLLYLFSQINFSLIIRSLKDANWVYFFLAFLIMPFSILIRSFNWGLILNRSGKKLSLKQLCFLNLLGISANLFLPAQSGELVKVYYGYRLHGLKEEIISSTLLDKLTSLIAVFLMGAVFSSLWGFKILPPTFFLIAFCLVVLLFIPRLLHLVNLMRLPANLQKWLDGKELINFSVLPLKLIFVVLFISFLGWLLSYLQLFLFCLTFKAHIDFSYLIAILPAVIAARLVPFVLSGFGTGEAAFVYFFGLVNTPPNIALLVSLTARIVSSVIPGVAGLIIFYSVGGSKQILKADVS